ncbi:hypothetical protein DFJ58DRAFT_913750 [Suillus subalutaceus]|uniref:uncharacterized protein n=1 Tax=Suillus subalutaceus TaxID=48586 RepID=UPI001B875DF4|nr:uncharacterized protein DFJ58DRAFT_913750 [Suillus subalutaceus]KAG1856059.1 hypothetical protein DFJ58DRAFT_913750 [Suillus subalutaceus]
MVMAQSTPRVWLITGSSTGFGRAMVEEVLLNGEIAVATLRKPSVLDDLVARYPRTQLLVLPLDVTNEVQVKSAFVQAKDTFGHVDVVYNNAGQVLFQELEGGTNGPCQGADGSLDSFTEVLAQELLPAWNIRIVNVHPGSTRTPLMLSEMLEPPALYASEPTAVTTKLRAEADTLIASDALIGVEAVTKRIWSVTRMDNEDLRKGMQEGIPGLVNMHTGMDSLGRVHAKIGRLQGELMWNMKVHYEH